MISTLFRRRYTNVGSTLATKRRYNFRRFRLEISTFQRQFNVELWLMRSSQRWKSYIDPISIFHVFATLIQRRKGDFKRCFNVRLTLI